MLTLPVRVKFYQTDAMKVVHHANYIYWLEEARTEYLRAGGILLNDLMEEGIVFPILRIECRYIHSAVFDDELLIHTWIRKIDRAQLVFDYEIVRKSDGLLIVQASSTSTYTRISDGKIVRLPKEKLKRLEEISAEDRK